MEYPNLYPNANLYIKNLDHTIDDDRLYREFCQFGEIISAKVQVDENFRSKGFGFVCFSSQEEATKAINEMNGRLVGSKRLYVGFHQSKEDRQAQLNAKYIRQANLRMQQMGQFIQPGTSGGPTVPAPIRFYGAGQTPVRPGAQAHANPYGTQSTAMSNITVPRPTTGQRPPKMQGRPSSSQGVVVPPGKLAQLDTYKKVYTANTLNPPGGLSIDSVAPAQQAQGQKEIMLGETSCPLSQHTSPDIGGKVTENHTLAPVEALSHIKCSACNKYLSYFPIYMNHKTLEPVCGRCTEFFTTKGYYIESKTYESFVQFFKLPCIYDTEGCIEHLSPRDVPQHEKTCSYRVVSCVLDCVWQGTVSELIDHVQQMHREALVINGEFEIDVLNEYETQNFLLHQDDLFALKRKFNKKDNTVQCSVSYCKSFKTAANYYYELTVTNGSRNLSMKFPIKPADNSQDNITELKVDNVKKSLNDPSTIIGYIKILNVEDKTGSDESRKPNPAIDIKMLEELECPVCLEYIIPPIFQCVNGHSICETCKTKWVECPSKCGSEINTQNVTLEKMALLLTYPCKFSESGCDFASKPDLMKQHQKHCIYGPQLCPLKDYEACDWKGSAKDVYSHVTANHHDSILEIDNLHIFINKDYFETEDNQCFIKRFMNVMFKIHYRYARDCFYWAVQVVGPQEETPKYKFEIDIYDNSNNNQKMFVRSLCTELKNKDETFNKSGQYVFLKREQIDSFLKDRLSYTIRITN